MNRHDLRPESSSVSEPSEAQMLHGAQWVRHPGDAIRLLVALVVLVITGLVLVWGPDMASGLQEDVAAVLPRLPAFVVLTLYSAYAVLLVLTPLALVVWTVWQRLLRLGLLCVLAALIAAGSFWVLTDWISAQLPSPPGGGATDHVVSVWGFQNYAWVAALAASLTVCRPWLSGKWYRYGWALLLVMPVLRLFIDAGAPSGRIFALAGGWAIGCAVLLLVGAPTYAPSMSTVLEGVNDAGCPVVRIWPADVDAHGSIPYFGVTREGSEVFVKLACRDQRDADLLFRAYRYIRLRQVGDEAPFSSLRRSVEHEAMVSVWAERAGVRTPRVIACLQLDEGSMILVFEGVEGQSLDHLAPDVVSDELLRSIWRQVARLRGARIAHRDLRRANILIAIDDAPVITDFGFSEISASEDLLDADVAQFVLATAIEVGPQRAVATAVDVLGPRAVAAAAPRMQVAALSRATQKALARHHGLPEAVRDEVRAHTGLESIHLVDIQRISLRRVVTAALLFAALWFLIPVVMKLPTMVEQLRGADWLTAAGAILVALIAFPAAALILLASVRSRIPFTRAVLVSMAGSLADQIGPVRVGSVAVNLRFLQKSGIPTTVASASVALYTVVGLATHVLLLVMFSIWAGSTVDLARIVPERTLLIAIALLFGVFGGLLLVPRVRRYLRRDLVPQAANVRRSLVALARQPLRLVLLVLGTVAMLMASIGALDASVRAVGGSVALPMIAVLFLAGATIAGAAPTPGGLGAVEVVLIGGLVAAGVSNEVAVPAVFLYRFATLWIPALLGWLALLWLRRQEYL